MKKSYFFGRWANLLNFITWPLWHLSRIKLINLSSTGLKDKQINKGGLHAFEVCHNFVWIKMMRKEKKNSVMIITGWKLAELL